MNRSHVAIFGASLFALLLPFVLRAEDTGPSAPIYCPNISQTLSFGMRDSQTNPQGQVTELQHFLSDYYDLNPDDYITAYFGRKTRDNVRRFQCETMQICSGDESTTGWGLVGRKTREAIKAHCGVQTTHNTPPPPPPAPTCTLNANPSSVILGSSSVLTWSSQNATTASITNIGTVATNGSQSVSPTQTTTYLSTFTGAGGSAQCSTVLSVTSATTTAASCLFNGIAILDGQSVTAYQSSSVPAGNQCAPQTRTCHNGSLDGSYQFPSCSVLPPVTTSTTAATGASCTTPWGTTVADGQTAQGFCPPTPGALCGLTKQCSNGQWVTWCPSGYKLCPASGSTPEECMPVANQCAGIVQPPPSPPPVSNGSCVYKGMTYAEGQSVTTGTGTTLQITVQCDNGIWGVTTDNAWNFFMKGENICDNDSFGDSGTQSFFADFGCTFLGQGVYRTQLGISTRHGNPPLVVTSETSNYCMYPANSTCAAYSIAWGDGKTDQIPATTLSINNRTPQPNYRTHTYSSAGSYVVSYTQPVTGLSNSTPIRVGSGTAFAPNQTQLASALTALQSALQAILQLLK